MVSPGPSLCICFRLWSTPDLKEYRGQIDKKYRRNIEAIVRRPNRDEEPEPTSKCPISAAEVPITQLECPSTKVRGVLISCQGMLLLPEYMVVLGVCCRF